MSQKLVDLQVAVEPRPALHLREQSVSGALGVDVLLVSDDVILLGQAQAVHSAEQQGVQGNNSLLSRGLVGKGAEEADSQRLLVESGGVQTLVVEATTLIDGSVVADAEVVRNIRPAEHSRVQHLEVTHLIGAGSEIVARFTGRVVHHYPRSGLVGQDSVGADSTSPLGLAVNWGAH